MRKSGRARPLLSAAFLRRVDAVTRTAEAIIAGDLARRIERTGSGDEFDRSSAAGTLRPERRSILLPGTQALFMAYELDHPEAAAVLNGARQPAAIRRAVPLASRLIARLYTGAGPSLRTHILSCLVRPLGPLGMAAIASGAFAGLLARAQPLASCIRLEDAVRFSGAQVFELARFSEQVQPEVLQQVAALFSDGPLGLSTISAAALALLLRRLQGRKPAGATALGGRSMEDP